ncbi:hypothetical protein [Fischerella sp. PCC 9605]|uniref:hypothetical protein n=1 Tax=Fischerella sp. PCC 9605 TaxID=1173024 RepID=UPI003FA496F4
MTKPRKKQGNPDFRHRVTSRAPTSEEIESRLIELLSPGTFANLKDVKDKDRNLRDRVLTLPVMAVIVLSLVYREIHYFTDVLRYLEVEGLLWVEAISVSRQATTNRLESLPAHLLLKLFEQVIERLAAKKNRNEVAPMWASVASRFGAVWIADASTLEAVKKHLGQLQQKTGAVLGGKMLMVVEAFSHRPVAAFFDADAKRNETKWWQEITQLLPERRCIFTDKTFVGFILSVGWRY